MTLRTTSKTGMKMMVTYFVLLMLTFLSKTNCDLHDGNPRELKSNIFVDQKTYMGPSVSSVSLKRRDKRSVETLYSRDDEIEILNKHNEYRRQEGASGMEYMVCLKYYPANLDEVS